MGNEEGTDGAGEGLSDPWDYPGTSAVDSGSDGLGVDDVEDEVNRDDGEEDTDFVMGGKDDEEVEVRNYVLDSRLGLITCHSESETTVATRARVVQKRLLFSLALGRDKR